MTFLIRIFILLFLCCTHSPAVHAQEVPHLSVERLLSVANGELEGFAKKRGYRLLKNLSRLSIPGTTVVASAVVGAGAVAGALALASIPGTAVAGAGVGATSTTIATIVAGPVAGAGVVGATVAGIAVGVVGATVGVGTGIAVGAGVIVASTGLLLFFAGDAHHMYKVPFVSHYRSRFNYVLVDRTSAERIRGSCLYFFRMDESGYTLDIEIDNCSHDDIFPQEEVGSMRVRNWVDPFERYFSDQDEVVVSINVPI